MAPSLPDNVSFLVNSTLANFAAIVKTENDKTVVVSTLETLDEVLKALKKLSFQMSEEAASSLMVAVQDVLENKVRRGEQRHVRSPSPCSLDELAVLALVCSLCYVT